jgi:excisionase family DNA binding protein
MTTLLSVLEVSRYLKVSRMTAYRLIWAGKIPAVRAGHQVRVRPSDLAVYLKNSQTGARVGPRRRRQAARLMAALALAAATRKTTEVSE